uniref:Uncharacterized protein n=1 Tax=Arundo donax TaxID=35708 RepID=A0A0A8XVR0_ARUDO
MTGGVNNLALSVETRTLLYMCLLPRHEHGHYGPWEV